MSEFERKTRAHHSSISYGMSGDEKSLEDMERLTSPNLIKLIRFLKEKFPYYELLTWDGHNPNICLRSVKFRPGEGDTVLIVNWTTLSDVEYELEEMLEAIKGNKDFSVKILPGHKGAIVTYVAKKSGIEFDTTHREEILKTVEWEGVYRPPKIPESEHESWILKKTETVQRLVSRFWNTVRTLLEKNF